MMGYIRQKLNNMCGTSPENVPAPFVLDVSKPARLLESRDIWHAGQVELWVQNLLTEAVELHCPASDELCDSGSVTLGTGEGRHVRSHDRELISAVGLASAKTHRFRIDISNGIVQDFVIENAGKEGTGK